MYRRGGKFFVVNSLDIDGLNVNEITAEQI